MAALRRFIALVLAVVVLTTCEEFPEDPTGTDTSGPIQLFISTAAWPDVVPLGGTVELEIAVADGQGRAIADPPVAWTVETPSTGTVQGGAGSATATLFPSALGWVRISVALDDPDGRFTAQAVTDSVQVALAGVRILAPGADTILESLYDTVEVVATGVDADGANTGYDQFQWDVTGPGALEPLQIGGASSKVRAFAAGQDTVWVRAPGACDGGTCEAMVVIEVAQTPVSVDVTPSSVEVEIDATQQLTATARDARGYPIDGAAIGWSSDNASVASVSSAGVVTGRALGTTAVWATVQGTAVSQSVGVTVIRGPGDVTGVVYRDDDASGAFEAANDAVLDGATVDLIQGTSATGPVVQSTTTNLTGTYTFTGVPAGDYVVMVHAVAGTEVDPTAKLATVIEYQTTTVDFTFRGAPVGPVANARAASPGEIVALEGVATTALTATPGDGTLQDSLFYVQDAGAGIAVFTPVANFPVGVPAVTIGDSVRVVGVRQDAPNQKVLVVAASVTVLGIGRPDTLDVVAADINNLTYPSRLVRVNDAIIDSITGTRNEFVWARDPTGGGTAFLIYLNEATGLDGTTLFYTQRAYTVTGILTRHNTTYELKPRMAEDAAPGLLPLTSVGIARDLTPDSMWISVTGVVGAGTDAFGPGQFYLQDNTGGIRVHLPADSFPAGLPTVGVGDSVRIQGARLTYHQEAEIMASYVSVEGFSGEPVPYGITAGEINAGTAQGELHAVFEVRVDSITGDFSQYVWVSDPSNGDVLVIYIDADTGISGPGSFTVGSYYDITGIVSRFDAQFQLKPRSTADIVEVIQAIPVSDARAAAVTTELAVEGVIHTATGTFAADAAFLQDGTGGIQLRFPAEAFTSPPALQVGQRVKATGYRSEPDGIVSLEVYELADYGTGWPVDTLSLSFPSQILSGMHQGRLVRIWNRMPYSMQNSVWFEVADPNSTGNSTWVNVGPGGLSSGLMGVGGIYDVIGVPSVVLGSEMLLPRSDADVIEIDSPGALWMGFVNLPWGAIDSVLNVYSAGGAAQTEVKLPVDGRHAFASLKVPVGTQLGYAWAGVVGFDSLRYRSLDHSEFLDSDPDVNVVACLVSSCATGGSDTPAQYIRREVLATHEMYGLFPTIEEVGDNDGFATADTLRWMLSDQVVWRHYYAHAGTLTDGSDISDYYVFYAQGGAVVDIEVLARRSGVQAEGNLDSWLNLYDASQTPLVSDDDGTGTLDSKLQYTVPATGYYFVEVTIFNGGGSSGVYTLRVQVSG